jgi:hypothetical protein
MPEGLKGISKGKGQMAKFKWAQILLRHLKCSCAFALLREAPWSAVAAATAFRVGPILRRLRADDRPGAATHRLPGPSYSRVRGPEGGSCCYRTPRRFARVATLVYLTYIHNNPVKRGLVKESEEWAWSSWRFYFQRDTALLAMDEVEW